MTKPSRKPRSRAPRKITESSLRNIALHYLERYASSRENLKRILMRRVLRSAQVHDVDMDEAAVWVDKLVFTLADSGMVDDRTYAEGRTRALFRRGVSPKGIRQRLAQKGVDAELIDSVLSVLYEEMPDPDLAAAVKLVRRRRLGPYRLPEIRAGRRDKDLAAVGRAGFDFAIARRVIDADSVEELEALLDAPAF